MRALAVGLFLLGLGTAAHADTVISGGNIGNQTWTLANSPYTLQGDVTVLAGATLTIEAGVVVQATASSDAQAAGRNTSRVEITVDGALVVQGTSADPVTFKSTSTSNGTWYGIVATTNATQVKLDYASIQSAIYGITAESTGTVLQATNVTVSGASSYGVWLKAGNPTLTGLQLIGNSSYGAYVSDAASPAFVRAVIRNNGSAGVFIQHGSPGHSVSLAKCTLAANGTYGIYSGASASYVATIDVKNSIVTGSTYGVYRGDSAAWSVTYSNVWNNASYNYYGISAGTATIASNPLFVSATDLRLTSNSPSRFGGDDNADQGALPYDGVATPGLYGVLWSNTTLLAATGSYTATGDLTVAPGVTLTIEPGVTLGFAAATDIMMAGQNTSRGELVVNGRLLAQGTAANPITIASTSTSNGTWYGIELEPTAHGSALANLYVRQPIYGLVYRSTATDNTLANITVDSASSYGFWLRDGSPTLDAVSAISNSSYGFYVSDAASPTFTRCIARNNGSAGMFIQHGSPGHSVSLTRCTLNQNGTYGVYSGASASYVATINIVGSIITGSTYGVYRGDSAAWSVTNSNVWNNASYNYYGVSAGTACISSNPLYVSATDLRLTSNSPSRFGAPGNLDQGALPYDTVATPGLYGVLWSNTTLTAAGGPYTAGGDLTVAPNVVLAIEPGVTLSFTSATDIMMAGQNTSRGELTVLGTLVADGTPAAPITIKSSSTSNGTWYGIDLDASAHDSVLDNVIVRYAIYGLGYRSTGTGNSISRFTSDSSSSYGVWLRAGSPAIDGLTSMASSSYGVYVSDAANVALTNCVVRNSGSAGIFVQHGTPGHSVSVTNCTINANGTYGIYSGASASYVASIDVKNSIITNSTYGVYRGDSATWSVTYSDVWNNASYNYYGVTAGTGTISANPQFASATDLHVASSSVAIDSGTTGPAADAEGVARPLDGNGVGGAQWDMGAYEYVAAQMCGNGVLENGESCDDGNNNGTYGHCNASCTAMGPHCGDGVMNGPEQCDDGNASNTDACLTTCAAASCGDGFVRAGVEACDDGNTSNTDACLNTCAIASCGDGFVHAGVEACDDGNASNSDACLNTCVIATCGDGFTQAGVEECDDGNLSNTDACLNVCRSATCGDGFTEAGVEGCDDGNKVDNDACTNTCVSSTCGDGVVQADVEQCDDGNRIDTDGCRNNCLPAACGDGVVEAGSEECDDGNTMPGDGCDAQCNVETMTPDGPRDGGGCCQSSRDASGTMILAMLVVLALGKRGKRRPTCTKTTRDRSTRDL